MWANAAPEYVDGALCFLTTTALAGLCGICVKTLYNSMSKLSTLGCVKIMRQSGRNVYTLYRLETEEKFLAEVDEDIRWEIENNSDYLRFAH